MILFQEENYRIKPNVFLTRLRYNVFIADMTKAS